MIKALDDASSFVARSAVQNDSKSHHNDQVRLRLHVSSTSPFSYPLVLFKCNVRKTVTLKVTLTVRVNEEEQRDNSHPWINDYDVPSGLVYTYRLPLRVRLCQSLSLCQWKQTV